MCVPCPLYRESAGSGNRGARGRQQTSDSIENVVSTADPATITLCTTEAQKDHMGRERESTVDG